MSWFHPEEESQVGALMGYEDAHPGTRYLVEYADGSAYVGEYDTSYESDNTGDLDIEMDDLRYDEFYQVAMQVVRIVLDGGRGQVGGLTLDYRDFPARITDADTGTVVYPPG